MAFRVLLDACVLLPYQLCDLLLRLAEDDLYEPLWSEEILDEVDARFTSRPWLPQAHPDAGFSQCRDHRVL